MKRITTAAALRKLAEKILDATKDVEADDDVLFVNLDEELSSIENG